jgi:pyruvate dehydrogenase E2 component (dihydrolipoamide acetyltransferase)
MARTPIYMPKYGMTMVQAEITEWYVEEGDKVSVGTPILSIETEKTTVDVEASADGYVTKPLFETGDEVEVGAILLYIVDTPEEVQAGAETEGAPAAEPGTPAEVSPAQAAAAPSADEPGKPIAGLRKKIADNMRGSLQNSAQLTHMREVRADALCKEKEKDENISFTDLLVKQLAEALSRFELARDQLIDGRIVRKERIDIGLAVALDEGLIVPVIRDADKRSLAEIAIERRRLAAAARSSSLSPNDLGGAAATLSSLGPQQIDFFTPILNPPESVILGVGRIKDAPVAENGKVVVGKTLGLSLTFDHQILDGKEAADFLDMIASLIEHPEF